MWALSDATYLIFLTFLTTLLWTGCAAKKSSSWRDKDKETLKPLPPTITYDQRQTGKYNINVNIKDVAIISIDPESLSSNVGVSRYLLPCGITRYCS